MDRIYPKKVPGEKTQDWVKRLFTWLYDEGYLTPVVLTLLREKNYSKQTFGISRPLIVTDRRKTHDSSGVARYWQGFRLADCYYVCSQWELSKADEYERKICAWCDRLVGEANLVPQTSNPKVPSVGSVVEHEKYGRGILKSIIDGRACVQFDDEEGVKVFQSPQCFEQGYLKIVPTLDLSKPDPTPTPTPTPKPDSAPGPKWQTFYYINCPGCGGKIGKISAGTEFTTTCTRCAKKLAIEVNESSVAIKVM